MAIIPDAVRESKLSMKLSEYLEREKQGKSCDLFTLPDYPKLILILATDRISIFNFILPDLMQGKGETRTAFTVFILTNILNNFNHHLVTFGADIDRYLPEPLCGKHQLQKKALIAKRLDIIPVECVIRNYLDGSGWKSYQKNGRVAGVSLPPGLKRGSKLPEPIFHPTEKSETDDELPPSLAIEKYGKWIKEFPLVINDQIVSYAERRGLLLVDYKMEFGRYNGEIHIADEVIGFESRWWDKGDWETALMRNELPAYYDKEIYRQWGKGVETPWGRGINGLNPLDPEHAAFVSQLKVPADISSHAVSLSRHLFSVFADCHLGDFQKKEMGIGEEEIDLVNCYQW